MQHVYIAACDEKGGIYHYGMEEDGHLSEISFTPLAGVMYLLRAGDTLYALLRAPFAGREESGLMTLHIEEDGHLTQVGDILSTGGRCACHLTGRDGVIYAVNYLSGNVIRLPEGHTAAHHGHGVHPTRQEGPHTHYVGYAPDGKLLVTDLGLDAIVLYDGALTECGRLSLPAGQGPRHLIFSPDGRYLYCANELGNTVSVFAYAGEDSTLLASYPTLPEDFTGQDTTAAIRVAGDELLVSDRGADIISVFRMEGERLVFSYRFSCGGVSPRDFAVTPDGRFLISTNEFSDSVTVFAKEDGRFTPCPQHTVSMPRPLCVIF